MREYVINELPALLYGVEYKGRTYTFMIHPTLKTSSYTGDDQRTAMVALLSYMREHHVSNTVSAKAMCHIFDVEIPYSLLVNNDESSTESTVSSTSHSDTNSINTTVSEEPVENNNSTILWIVLFLQVK